MSYVTKIIQFLKSNIVISLPKISEALNDRPRSSLYRDLKKVPLITSYSHSGQYHALKSAAKFDQYGLWFFNDISFAAQGTLKATLISMITHADAGMTQGELKIRLRITVQNRLAELIKSQLVERTLLPQEWLPQQPYLYVSKDQTKATTQLQNRVAQLNQNVRVPLPADNVQIDILLAVIRCPDKTADEAMLAMQLKTAGLKINECDILNVLRHYDLKKNRT